MVQLSQRGPRDSIHCKKFQEVYAISWNHRIFKNQMFFCVWCVKGNSERYLIVIHVSRGITVIEMFKIMFVLITIEIHVIIFSMSVDLYRNIYFVGIRS